MHRVLLIGGEESSIQHIVRNLRMHDELVISTVSHADLAMVMMAHQNYDVLIVHDEHVFGPEPTLVETAKGLTLHRTSFIIAVIEPVEDNRQAAIARGVDVVFQKPVNARALADAAIRLISGASHHPPSSSGGFLVDRIEAPGPSASHHHEKEMFVHLLRACECWDRALTEHLIRVADLAHAIAHRLGLGAVWTEDFRWAALLHDIGKIGVHEDLARKTGALSQSERLEIETHTTKGERILGGSSSPLVKMAVEIALYHHERWNGSGYPEGLQGSAIPLSARIVSVADVYDALVSVRSYKSGWTEGEAIRFIKNQSAELFDPDVVAAFLDVIGERHRAFSNQASGRQMPIPTTIRV